MEVVTSSRAPSVVKSPERRDEGTSRTKWGQTGAVDGTSVEWRWRPIFGGIGSIRCEKSARRAPTTQKRNEASRARQNWRASALLGGGANNFVGASSAALTVPEKIAGRCASSPPFHANNLVSDLLVRLLEAPANRISFWCPRTPRTVVAV